MTIVSAMEVGLLTREKADEQWVSEYICDSVKSSWEGRLVMTVGGSFDLAVQWARNAAPTFHPQASVKSERDFMEFHAPPRVAQWPLAIKVFIYNEKELKYGRKRQNDRISCKVHAQSNNTQGAFTNSSNKFYINAWRDLPCVWVTSVTVTSETEAKAFTLNLNLPLIQMMS